MACSRTQCAGYRSGLPSSVRKVPTDGEGLYTRALVIGQWIMTLNPKRGDLD